MSKLEHRQTIVEEDFKSQKLQKRFATILFFSSRIYKRFIWRRKVVNNHDDKKDNKALVIFSNP